MTLAARIRRLSVAFHGRTILHDITLDIPAEERKTLWRMLGF